MSPESQRELEKICKLLHLSRQKCEETLKVLRAIAEERRKRQQETERKRY